MKELLKANLNEILKNLIKTRQRIENHIDYLKRVNDDFICTTCLDTIEILESRVADLDFDIECLKIQIEKIDEII